MYLLILVLGRIRIGTSEFNKDMFKLKKMLVLVGLMGAGKTSVGKKLADNLGVAFMDADNEIELAAGMTIVEIFEKFGESYFREGEKKVIKRLIKREPQILATGGGAFLSKEIRDLINSYGISIWLKADLETLWGRVSGNRNRPLLNQPDAKLTLEDLIKIRYPIYQEADIIVESKPNISHGIMVKKILDELKIKDLI